MYVMINGNENLFLFLQKNHPNRSKYICMLNAVRTLPIIVSPFHKVNEKLDRPSPRYLVNCRRYPLVGLWFRLYELESGYYPRYFATLFNRHRIVKWSDSVPLVGCEIQKRILMCIIHL